MKILKKSDLAKLILNEKLSFDERKSLITEELSIDLPRDIEDGENLLDFVYDFYIQVIEKYKISEKLLYQKTKKVKEKQGTIKEFIILTIQEKKKLTKKELHDIVNLNFIKRYGERGKTSRTRCRKVIQQLRVENKIMVTADNIISWKD